MLGYQKSTINNEKIKEDNVEVQKTKNVLLLLLNNLSHYNSIVTSPEKFDQFKKSNYIRKQQNILILHSWKEVKRRLKKILIL